MRSVSHIGFWAMIALGIGAFARADKWRLTVLLMFAALAVGIPWASTGARLPPQRSVPGTSEQLDDEDLLRELGRGRAHEEAPGVLANKTSERAAHSAARAGRENRAVVDDCAGSSVRSD